MSVQERMKICHLIEKMENDEAYSKKLGLENKSRLRESLKIQTTEKVDDKSCSVE